MFLLFLWDGTITMFSKGHGLQIRDIGLEVRFKIIINDIRNKIQKGNAGRL